jgi:hypothetical protein
VKLSFIVRKDCSFETVHFPRQHSSKRLLTLFPKNKSLKRIEFIDCKAGRMTYEFLKIERRICGVTLPMGRLKKLFPPAKVEYWIKTMRKATVIGRFSLYVSFVDVHWISVLG